MREVSDREKTTSAAIARNDKSERKIVALCARLKAAPELRASCNSKSEPSICLGLGPRLFKASVFETLSIAITASATEIKKVTALR